MNGSDWLLVLAFVAGSIRTVQLWRRAGNVEVVNVAVMSALGQGKGHELADVLKGAGAAPYLVVARGLGEVALRLLAEHQVGEARLQLERRARTELLLATRRLRAGMWLDAVTLVAIGSSGVWALVFEPPAPMAALALGAATLLWFSNVRWAQSIVIKMHAAAAGLIDTILAAWDELESSVASDRGGGH